MSSPKRICTLESIRIFMMIIIFLSHLEFLKYYFYGSFYENYIHNPTMGVDYFFVISGFGMMKSKSIENATLISSIKYSLSKIKRIYFVYIISLLCMIPYQIILYSSDNFIKTVLSLIIKFFICSCMLQSLSGMISFSHSFNGVCWFLSSLFIIYLLSPSIICRLSTHCKKKKRIIFPTIIVIMLCILTRWGLLIVDNNTIFDDLSYGFPLSRIFYVIFGMCLCKISEDITKKYPNSFNNVTEIIVTTICFIWYIFRNSVNLNVYFIYTIDVILCGLILIVFSQEKGVLSKILSKSIFTKLSKYTMYVYLFHYPVRNYVDLLFCNDRMFLGDLTGIVEAIIVIVITVIIVSIIYNIDSKVKLLFSRTQTEKSTQTITQQNNK